MESKSGQLKSPSPSTLINQKLTNIQIYEN